MTDHLKTIREALNNIEFFDFAKEALAALAALEQAMREPVMWQRRMRPTWGHGKAPWGPWVECSEGSAKDCWKTPLLHDWAYEARALYTAAPPVQQAQRPDFHDEWTGYLKDGETPFERFRRERKDLDALTKLYQRALEENEQLKAQPAQQAQPIKSICTDCRHTDSWGLPDKPHCNQCEGGKMWEPLNASSVNPNAAQQAQPTDTRPPDIGRTCPFCDESWVEQAQQTCEDCGDEVPKHKCYCREGCVHEGKPVAQQAQPMEPVCPACKGSGEGGSYLVPGTMDNFVDGPCRECEGLGIAQQAQAEAVPQDVFTHRDAWRKALLIAKAHGEVDPPTIDDPAYWEHEIQVFDRTFDALAAAPQPKEPSK